MMIFRYVLLISFAGFSASQALFSASGGAGSARGGGVAVVSVVVSCSLCERPKKGECKGCHTQPYCSAACQMIDWPSHKTLCKRK